MAVEDHRRRWREEQQAAWLYRQLVAVEKDPAKTRLFTELAAETERQAQRILAEIQRLAPQEAAPAFVPESRARLVGWLLRRLGPRAVSPVLAAMKVRGISVYRAPPPIPVGHALPTSVAEIGRRHGGSGGSLRAAVFGVNDGLVSNASLILGVAGATAGATDNRVVLLSGVAGLLAGAFSMAAGEYISVRSQRELFEYQIGQEREELELYPDAEAEELALIYQARGVPVEEARKLGRRLVADRAKALDTLAREELGLNPDELGSPWGAAISSFLSFVVGAILPLLPFLLVRGRTAIFLSAGLAGLGLFAVGAALSLFTGRRAVWGGLRMLIIGGAAGAATYLIGSWLGVGIS